MTKKLIRIITSPKVFVFTLIWLMILVFFGTITQKDIGLYAAQLKYFSSYYGQKNIRINAIVPGPFPNINKAANNNKKFLNNLKNSTMLKRFGKPIETAKPTIFLLSDASSYMTGHSLIVDGGWTAW